MLVASAGPLDADFDELVNDTIASWHVPGLSIAVVSGEQVFAKGYGMAILPDTPATPETLFYTGSTSKAFLGAAWADLIESEQNKKRGTAQIRYDTPLQEIIRDDFVLQDECATKMVTVEDALSHRTGMSGHDSSYGGLFNNHQKLVRNLRHLPITRSIRSGYEYCNYMYVGASHAFEVYTGQWIGKTWKEKIWVPLSMDSTYLTLQDAQESVNPLATGYGWSKREEKYIREEHMVMPEVAGAGGIISTVLDYAEWIKALLYKRHPLSKNIVAQMFAPRSIRAVSQEPFTGPVTYALGWTQMVYKGTIILTHDGGLLGFGSRITLIPERHWGIAIFGNTGYTSNTVAKILAFHLIDNLLDVPSDSRFEHDAADQEYFDAMERTRRQGPEKLYPNIPALPIKHALPLGDYRGTYLHPGYQSLTFTLELPPWHIQGEATSKVLIANVARRTWPFSVEMEHANAEHFVAHLRSGTGLVITKRVKAEFRIGADGQVGEVGIAMEEGMPDHKFWFKRAVSGEVPPGESSETEVAVPKVNGVHTEEANGFQQRDGSR